MITIFPYPVSGKGAEVQIHAVVFTPGDGLMFPVWPRVADADIVRKWTYLAFSGMPRDRFLASSMSDSRRICVFCGSSPGLSPAYADSARAAGREIVAQGAELVFGGGQVGLMGIIANAVLEAQGKAIGVIPEALATRELAHHGLTALHVVSGMHERKAMMAALSTAFLTIPGGIGTFEEFFEILTWGSLGFHHKPIGVLNVNGYFDPLLAMLEHGITQKFIRHDHLHGFLVGTEPARLIRGLMTYTPPPHRSRDFPIEES